MGSSLLKVDAWAVVTHSPPRIDLQAPSSERRQVTQPSKIDKSRRLVYSNKENIRRPSFRSSSVESKQG